MKIRAALNLVEAIFGAHPAYLYRKFGLCTPEEVRVRGEREAGYRVCPCGNSFFTRARGRGGQVIYCPKCRGITLVCSSCGKMFQRHRSCVLRTMKDPNYTNKRFFCSRECFHNAKKDISMTGKS